MKVWRWIFGGVALAGAASCAALGDFASDDPGFAEAPGVFEGRFLALADASMAGTAYGDTKAVFEQRAREISAGIVEV